MLKSQLYYIEKYAGLPGILALCAVIELLIKEAEGGVPCFLDDDEVVLNRCLTRWYGYTIRCRAMVCSFENPIVFIFSCPF